MKTKLLLLLVLANFSIYAQTNLVPNGGFESWVGGSPQNWTIANSVSSSTDKAEGQYSAKLSLTDKTLAPKVTAQVLLKAGKTYIIKFKYKYLNSNYSGLHPIALKIFQNGSGSTTSTSSFATNNNWTPKEITFTPDMDLSYDLSISAASLDDETFDVLIDDVSVIDVDEPAAQYTLIPDPNFEKKLIALGIDSGTPDGKVMTSKISPITSLDLYNSNITDLKGIEDFTALEILTCRKNQLTTINLEKNTKLIGLNVAENKLTNLDISSNISLESLDCQRNQITNLNVSKNIKLVRLTAMVNQLTALETSYNTLLTELYISSNKLTNLNIDNNTALKELNCGNNGLTSLNTSKNINLIFLYCHYNQITSLEVSKNVLLSQFMCNANKLKSIDVSNNPELEMFDCLDNQLTSLTISKNPKIYELACENNQLTYLNLKNGNNVNLDLSYSNFINNPNLTCIEVDDVDYSNANWSAIKDATANYSILCKNLSIEDSVFDKITMYPNPTKGEVNINNIALDKATVYNSLGQLVKSFTLNSSNTDNTINLSGLPKGVYYVYLINQDAASAKKIIVE